ncbi:hypothetical protein WME94_42750 [Sorangium sp. So ce429]
MEVRGRVEPARPLGSTTHAAVQDRPRCSSALGYRSASISVDQRSPVGVVTVVDRFVVDVQTLERWKSRTRAARRTQHFAAPASGGSAAEARIAQAFARSA